MKNYAIHNELGEIIRVVGCTPDTIQLQLQEGEGYLECDATPGDFIDLETMTVIPQAVEPIVEEPTTYKDQRRFLYGSVESQLDKLWHAMDSGEIPKATDFYNHIKTIKDAIPKDGSAAPTIIYEVNQIPEGDTE